jgi:hypothetical protein
MADDDRYDVLVPESGSLSEDGSECLLTFLKEGTPLSFVVPSEFLLSFAAMSFELANRAQATAGNLANQQILQAEGAEVYSDSDHAYLHFRLADVNTDLPISITRKAAKGLLGQLAASLAKGPTLPSEPPR